MEPGPTSLTRGTTPIAVTAGTTYVASYFAPNGGYSADPAYFANGGHHERAVDRAAVLGHTGDALANPARGPLAKSHHGPNGGPAPDTGN